jgi:hypothetical protein
MNITRSTQERMPKNELKPAAGLEPAALRLRVSRSNRVELRRLVLEET